MLTRIIKVVFMGLAFVRTGNVPAVGTGRSVVTGGIECAGSFINHPDPNVFEYCATFCMDQDRDYIAGSAYRITRSLNSVPCLPMAEDFDGELINHDFAAENCHDFNAFQTMGAPPNKALGKIQKEYNCDPLLTPTGGIGINQLPAVTQCFANAADAPLDPSKEFAVTKIELPEDCRTVFSPCRR